MIYGPPKVGKTTVTALLDNCLLIDLEDGSSFVDAMKIKVDTLQDLYNAGEQIKAENRPYKYIAIDSISRLEELCEVAATNTYKKTAIGSRFEGKSVLELPNGAGYYWLRQTYKHWIDYLNTLAEHLIFIGHLKDKLIEQNGKEVSAKDIDLTGKIRTITCADADAVGYVFRKEDELWITFESKEEIVCGARPEHLKGKTIPFEWNNIFIN